MIQYSKTGPQSGNLPPTTRGGDSLPILWSGGAEEQVVSPSNDFWCEALGLGVAGAVASQFLFMEGVGGQRQNPGLHTIISTRIEAPVWSTLARLVQPLRAGQVRPEALAKTEARFRQQKIERLASHYASYLRTNTLRLPHEMAYFKETVAQLENTEEPIRLMENPLPGRLVLALEKSGSPLLALYDDAAFSALLDAARKPCGMLDLELLGKSWRHQIFDGAYLEGISIRTIVPPRAWAIVVARPETIARLLLACEPVIKGFANCCWVVEATESAGLLEAAPARANAWPQIISKLMASCPLRAGDAVGLSQGARQAQVIFRQEVARVGFAGTADPRFLVELEDLVSKLACALDLTESPTRITSATQAQLVKAIGWAKLSVHYEQALVQITRQRLAQEQFERQCELVRNKVLAFGPMTARELAHTFDDQNYKWLLPVLHHLVQTDEILKRPDGRFDNLQRWLGKLTFREC